MNHPAFFYQAPAIKVQDRLAQFFGACDDGIITYHYVDAVRLAGHSCPTVAGAYLMTRRALGLLYPNQTPERGGVQVRFSAALDDGVTGVVASVVSLITGAAGLGGFKGIGHDFRRQNLMYFRCAIEGQTRFERLDNGTAAVLEMRIDRVEANPRTAILLRKILTGVAEQQERSEFSVLWQERVKCMLIDHADDPELIAGSLV